ncbi:MAG: hypothetical protein ACFFBH_16905 [Promethearchaeota archaeon]
MRKLDEIGICPQCQCSLSIYKTSNYKRFVRCEVCETSYALPKKGNISNSALDCPRTKFPILIVEQHHLPAYFWTDKPCFSCIDFDRCAVIKELKLEFKELKVYGY